MGKIIQFGDATTRCRWCKGTGIRKGTEHYVHPRKCTSCDGVGYIVPYDNCLHACGCTNECDPQLILVCMPCYNNECESEGVQNMQPR